MVETMDDVTISLPSALQPLLDSLRGVTLDQKITHLLLGEARRNLEACEKEQLEFEIKYGMEFEAFQRELSLGESGALGDVFRQYDLETDAMRWSDLVAEKRYWLEQIRALRESEA
jgi:hypothetical protein